MEKLPSLFSLLLSLPYALPAAANSLEINCPATQVQTSIITNLYSDWIHEPVAQSLQGIDIEEANEQRFLVCLYGETQAFKTSRPEPPRKTCQIQQDEQSFLCEPTPAALSGTVTISGVTKLDLASGRTHPPFLADVIFANLGDSLILRMMPRGNALIKMKIRAPNRGCESPRGSFEVTLRGTRTFPHRNLSAYIFCVTTNEGRDSEFFITESTSNPVEFEVNYKTW